MLWHCVDVLDIPPLSRKVVFLFSAMDGLESQEGAHWLLVASPLMLVFFSGLDLKGGHSALVVTRVARVELAVIIASRFFECTFYGLESYFGLDS